MEKRGSEESELSKPSQYLRKEKVLFFENHLLCKFLRVVTADVISAANFRRKIFTCVENMGKALGFQLVYVLLT